MRLESDDGTRFFLPQLRWAHPLIRTYAATRNTELVLSAMSSHSSDQKVATPTAGLQVQPSLAGGYSSATVLKSGRPESYWTGRHPMHSVRPAVRATELMLPIRC